MMPSERKYWAQRSYWPVCILIGCIIIGSPVSPSLADSGPNIGWVARMSTCAGRISFIQRTGSILTEQVSTMSVPGKRCGAIFESISGTVRIGTQIKMTGRRHSSSRLTRVQFGSAGTLRLKP